MILFIQQLACGNALRLILRPPRGAERWRLLRKAGAITGPDDPDAVLVTDGTDNPITDIDGLANGVEVTYQAFFWVSGAWQATASRSATPAAGYADISVDAQSLLRERLYAGLNDLVSRGLLAHPEGRLPVLTASPLFEGTSFPVVSVHLDDLSIAERGIGEGLMTAYIDDLGEHEAESVLDRWSMRVIGWCLSADARLQLRQAIRSTLFANLAVFDAVGMQQVDFQFQDTEDFESYSAPVYSTSCTFICLAPCAISTLNSSLITDVTVTPIGA